MIDPMMTASDAAWAVDVSLRTLQRAVTDGRIPNRGPRRPTLVLLSEVVAVFGDPRHLCS